MKEFKTLLSIFKYLKTNRKKFQKWANKRRSIKLNTINGTSIKLKYTIDGLVDDSFIIYIRAIIFLYFISGIFIITFLPLEGQPFKAAIATSGLWIGAWLMYKIHQRKYK